MFLLNVIAPVKCAACKLNMFVSYFFFHFLIVPQAPPMPCKGAGIEWEAKREREMRLVTTFTGDIGPSLSLQSLAPLMIIKQ